jgi:hypothetical protein
MKMSKKLELKIDYCSDCPYFNKSRNWYGSYYCKLTSITFEDNFLYDQKVHKKCPLGDTK